MKRRYPTSAGSPSGRTPWYVSGGASWGLVALLAVLAGVYAAGLEEWSMATANGIIAGIAGRLSLDRAWREGERTPDAPPCPVCPAP